MNWRVKGLKAWRSTALSSLMSVCVVIAVLLSGCVRYDVDLKFWGSNHGEVTQHVRLDESLPTVGDSIAALWLDTLEKRVKQLGGRVQHPSAHEWVITFPFHSTQDLQTKFNHVLQYQAQYQVNDRLSRKSGRRPANAASYLHIQTYSLVLWHRNHLQYDLDLRGLPVVSAVAADADVGMILDLSLSAPWGVQVIDSGGEDGNPGRVFMPVAQQGGKRVTWQLQPGIINHLEVIFWVPNALGIGMVAIVVLVLVGMGIKKWGSKSVVNS